MTDRHQVSELELARRIAALPAAYAAVVTVLLRDRDLPSHQRADYAALVAGHARRAGAQFVVADDLALARDLGASGLHLASGRSAELAGLRAELGPEAWLSIGCHAVEELAPRARAGASALFLSPIFSSPGKGTPLGLGALRRARSVIDRLEAPALLVALGGVMPGTAESALEHGADAVAAIRAELSEPASLARIASHLRAAAPG